MSDLWSFIVGTLPFLWSGLLMTLFVSAVVVVMSAIVGALFGVGLAYGPLWLRVPLRIYSDILRGIPLLVVIFSIYYLLPFAGLNLQPLPAVLLALTMFKTAHVSEIARGAIQSIAKGQIDAGMAIGLTFHQRLVYVVMPQALRRFLPPWINSVTDAVKGSSLVSLVGIVDLMLASQQVIGRTYQPLPIYMLAAGMYFIINFSLSTLSRRLEARYAYVRE
jgi:polar amino acid transport system permease protein